jgi:hypothetical protein
MSFQENTRRTQGDALPFLNNIRCGAILSWIGILSKKKKKRKKEKEPYR